MASLELPSKEKLREIEARQDAKEKEVLEKRQRADSTPQDTAARLIQVPEDLTTTIPEGSDHHQRNYRGYRERRELKGHALSSSERWTEVSVVHMTLP